ncbi:MAG: glycosyltransferase 87 family protein [Actinomycetota bacterium]|nr:glycosyltransferase 87 family protein [Actinomycetota bacterium]
MPLALLGSFLYWQLLARFAALPSDLREGSNDLAIYRDAGEAILGGQIPYRDFFIEYPPGSLPAFVPPALFSVDRAGYITLFASEMALVLVVALVLTALAARKLRGLWAWPVPALTFVAAAIMLYPVAVTRYDAVVALTLAGGALGAALGGRYVYLAYASLGLGAAAKLVPALATVPLARREAARGYAVFFGVLVLFFAPAVLLGGDRFLNSFAYHAERGLQVESLAASILLKLGWVSGISFEYGAFEVQGRGVGLASSLSLPMTGVLLLITALVMYRHHRRGGLDAGRFPRYAAALILAFMLGSKVLSPQYIIWLLPLVPLGAEGLAGAGVSLIFLTACWTTTQVFPIHYGDLLNGRYPGPDLLLARNLLLVILWALLLFLPSRNPETL